MELPELKTPWLAIEPMTVVSTGEELRRELGPRHVLKGKSLIAVARRQDCDDVLFTIEDGSGQCAVVHLTYSGKEESDPKWPWTELFPSLEEWRLKRMTPDHEDFRKRMKKMPNQTVETTRLLAPRFRTSGFRSTVRFHSKKTGEPRAARVSPLTFGKNGPRGKEAW